MKAGFYAKIAWDGIRKNKRLYFPYILTGGVMVMMYYILSFMIESPALAQMPGGSVLMTVLPLGCIVIAVFSLLFLFYTNSFLIKQRYREFGLYNILGMDKRNIGKVMIWETLFVALFAIGSGLIIGIILSKAAELVLLNLLNMDVTYSFSIGVKTLRDTPLIYGGIYLLLLVNSLIKVGRSKPLELMQSNKVGERTLAQNCVKYLVKGSQVAVVGSIQTGSYERDGVKRQTFDVRADQVEFLSRANATGANGQPQPGVRPSRDQAIDSLREVEDDDMPF